MTAEQYICDHAVQRLLSEVAMVTLVDARTREEFDEGHLLPAVNVPDAGLADFVERSSQISGGLVVTTCDSTGVVKQRRSF